MMHPSRILSAALMALAVLAALALPAMAGDAGWDAGLTVTSGRASNSLSLGRQPDATIAHDGRYDVPALLGGTLRAWFSLGEGQQYWRDVRSTADADGWLLIVESDSPAPVTLTWDASAFAGFARAVMIDDQAHVSIPLAEDSSYTFTPADDAPRSFRIFARK